MVFKRPEKGRDGQSGRSSNRAPKGGDNAKKSFSGSREKSSNNSDRSEPKKRYGSDASFGGERRSSSSADRKPYGGRSDGDNKSSFSGGSSSDKKSFAPKGRPYTGRPSGDEKSSFGGGYGDKKSFSPKSKPYSGRPTGDDRAPKSFSKESTGKRPFSKDKFSSDRPSSDRPRSNKFGDKPSGDRSYSKDKFGSDRPKRNFDSNPSRDGGFKKREFDPKDKPYTRSEKPKYDKPREAPERTMRSKKSSQPKDDGLIRLNRYIANAGVCSRRKADELILAGVVTVNGEVIDELGAKIDPIKDEIRYNGETLKREKMVYVLLNKPKDYITTTEDPQERRTVMHLVEKASRERIYPIGRLDRNTTGLLLMTNDGELADKLSHPRSQITKLYQVELNKSLTQGDLNKIQFGLELEDGPIKPDAVSYVAGASKREVGIQIHSGKNRIVRRMFEHLGYEVVKLDRVVYAGLTKKDLPRGRWRFLDEKEIIQLKHLIK
ncbi:MAG: pseudouridine synthase [Sphingobacteriaceae bacterium]|nr:MAG: pseudouridine synthase [Sphingobacteriaceae bacterium]